MKRTLLIAIVIASLLIVGIFVTYYENNLPKNSGIPVPTSLITSLAYEHWSSIAAKNLTQIMSQYSAHYEAIWWFVNATSIGPTNGRYDCNIPQGPNNCSYFPEFAWKTFFNDTPTLSYAVCNFSLTPEIDGRASVTATVYYELNGLNEKLVVPFVMDFLYYNSTWAVTRDWFGLSYNQAILLTGNSTLSCS